MLAFNRVAALLMALAIGASSAHAAVPHQINYQGFLTDPGGTPVNTASTMVFKLYTAGGTEVYSETQNSVPVTNGVFNVIIGSVTPIPGTVLFDQPYYLGIKIGADTEMTPRQFVAASPYAIRSASTEALAPTAVVPGSQVTGALSSATLPTNGIVYGQGTGGVGVTAAGVAGQVLAGSAGAPVWTGSPALSGNLTLVNSTATAGNVMKGAERFIHNYNGNLFVGRNAGNFTLTGTDNTMIGGNALAAGTSGSNNTGIGYVALQSNTSGNNNIALGFGAGTNLTTGDNNIAIGNSGVGGEANTIRLGDPAVHAKTLLAGNVGIGTASPLVKLHVTPGTAKTDPANTRAFAVLTSEPLGANGDPNNPFGLDVRLSGGAAVAARSVYLQSTNFNTADGGNILLQPFGGRVGIGATSTGSMLTVAGKVESTTGGVKFPDGNTQTKALANCSAEGDVAVMRLRVWVCRSSLGYVDNGDGTVTDYETGLMWEKKTACGAVTLTDPHCVLNTYTYVATAYVGTSPGPTGTLFSDFAAKLNGLNESTFTGGAPCFAGHCDWRIPTVGELQTILASCPGGGLPCINAIFGPTQASFYSSSSELASVPGGAWDLLFSNGLVGAGFRINGWHARAVRSDR